MRHEILDAPRDPFEVSCDFVLEQTDFPELGRKFERKVRDVYDNDEELIFVTTDRYSAFDRNLAIVPFKG